MSRIAITCGDPAGVGPEIIARVVRDHPEWHDRLCLIGPSHWLRQHRGSSAVEVLSVGDEDFIIRPGEPSEAGAEVARLALEAAADGTQRGDFRAVVTGPVSKTWMHHVGFHYPGQTEFFAERWGGEPTMAFAGGQLRVVLATWHVPLRDVMSHLTEKRLEQTVRHTAALCRGLGDREPRIAVCGLNPHAGEGGVMGDEEVNRIDPVLDDLRPDFPGLSRCLPGDTAFWRHLQGEFDAVIALYHDQGLAPVKTLEFDQAVNLTLGLPQVRTSPDHGTGFGLAGRGEARTGSLVNAIRLADRLSRHPIDWRG
ncbi:MAG: 4-hydroxythreonine-4-phosphate dehydrogenase PdxA [Opitutales bacterium]